MAKKNDMSNLKNLGIGILDTLNGVKEEDNKGELGMNESASGLSKDTSTSTTLVDNNKEHPNSDASKEIKETKTKRSFMLRENTIQRLNLLKLCSADKDLSSIVEDSINLYFEQNKDSIEQLISVYNKVK